MQRRRDKSEPRDGLYSRVNSTFLVKYRAAGVTVSNQSGCLYVVATPIGNLGDMSPRAIEVLNHVAVIAAEDTRHTGRLLEQFDCRTPQLSLHEHNEASRVQRLLERLQAGDDIALVSDAGTPLISDPGYRLVRAAREAGLTVLAVPGPSSITAALSVGGLPTDRFWFEGFLPARSSARRRRLEALADVSGTLVFFEAGRRLGATLSEMAEVFGGSREAAVARELTKRFETTQMDTLAQLVDWQAADANQARGEFVVMVAPAATEVADSADTQSPLDVDRLLKLLRQEGLGAKAAARVAAALSGQSVNALYARATDASTPK